MSADETNRETEAIEQNTQARTRRLQKIQEEQEALEKTIQGQQALANLMQDDADQQLELIRLKRRQLEVNLELIKTTTDNAEAISAALRALEDFDEEAEKNIENLQITAKLQQTSKNATLELGRSLAGLVPIVGGNADVTNSFAATLAVTAEKNGGLIKTLQTARGSFLRNITGVQGALNALNFYKQGLMAVIGGVVSLSFEMNKLSAEFNKATGQSNPFNLQLQTNSLRLASVGKSASETAAIMTDLTLNMTDFTSETEATQNKLTMTAGTLDALGVSAQTTSKNLQFMTTALAMSADEADYAARQLFTAAQELKVGPGEMADEFASASPKMAKFGKQSIETFIDLKEIAKGTGIELQTLLGITEQFDTFEGAAERVGQLNAMLGGPFLNTIDMVSVTDPAERMLLLRDAVADAGVAFEDMGYYQKQALAAAAGVEVSDLGALMAGDLEALGLASSESAMRMEELAAQTAFTKDLQQELKAAFMSVVVSLEPFLKIAQAIVSVFNYGIAVFQQAGAAIGGLPGFLFASIPGFVAVGFFASMVIRKFRQFSDLLIRRFPAAVQATNANLASLATSTAVLAGVQTAQSKVSQNQARSMAAIGPAGLTASGGIFATGTASGAAVGPTLAFGAAALMVGTGILLAGGGLALFVASFSLLSIPQMMGAAVALLALGTAIYYLLPAFTALGSFFLTPVGVALGLGLLGIGASVMMMGAAFMLVGVGIGVATAGIATLISSIGSLLGVGSLGAEELQKMADAINEIETDKAVTFSMTMRESARFVEALAALGTAPNQAVAVMGGGGGGGAPTIINVESVIQGDMRKLFDVIDSRVQKKLNQG